MFPFPTLSEKIVRSRATETSWRRGVHYFESGAVQEIVWRDGVLTAQVEGSQFEPYQVRVRFNEQGEIEEASCSCPYEGGGDCKHIVAALLALIRQPEKVSVRPSLRTLLEGQSREQLIALLLFLADHYPETIEAIEDFLTAPAPTEEQPTEVNLSALQAQIRAKLRQIARGAYQAYLDYGEWPLPSEALEPAINQARTFLDRGEPRAALLVLEAATIAWIEGCRRLDQDLLEDIANEENLLDFAEVWAEALLSADLSHEERRAWEQKLESWMNTIAGWKLMEYVMEMLLTAVRQGWDDPRLVAVMAGEASSIWEGEPPLFADDLAQVRLRILKARGRYEEALRLAKAEEQITSYLELLLEMGKNEQAVREALEVLQSPYEVFTLAKALAERGEIDLSFEVAAHGLTLGTKSGMTVLAEWLCEQAESHGRLDLARQAALEAFKANPTVWNYQKLKSLLGEEWENYKQQVLDLVAVYSSSFYWADQLIEIYLQEKMYPQAMALVEKDPSLSNLEKVIEAVSAEFPDWAFAQCYSIATEIMDSGQSTYYETAIAWLRRGRDILLRAGQAERWQAILDELLEKHQKKYKLRPMLESLK